MTDVFRLEYARSEDIPAITAIVARMWSGYDLAIENVQIEIHEMFSTATWRPTYYCLWHGDKLIGFAGWNHSWVNYHVYEFTWCNVLPEYQGQGFGRILVERRLDDIRKLGGKVVLMTTTLPEIYLRYGFKVTGEYALWAKDKTYLMALEL